MSLNNMTTFRSARTRRAARRSAATKKAVLVVVRFLMINIILFALTSPFIVLYGPFTNITGTAIGSIITSKHAHVLRYFLSPGEIARYTPAMTVNNGGTPGINIPQSPDSEVSLLQINSSRFKGFLLEVTDPTRVHLGVAANLGVKGELTSEIAKDSGALAAVNAGGFNDPAGTGNGSVPYGIIIHNGYTVYGTDAQGLIPLIGLDNNGVLITGDYTMREIGQLNIQDGISFGPNQGRFSTARNRSPMRSAVSGASPRAPPSARSRTAPSCCW